MPMFCQNCGNPGQTPETYCRSCGEFQADNANQGKRRVTVNGYFLASGFVSGLTILWCFLLAAGHLLRLIREGPDWLVNATLTWLIVVGFWNILTLYYAITLKRRFDQYRTENTPTAKPKNVAGVAASELLHPARYDDRIPSSLVEDTTKDLGDKVRR